HPDSAAVAVLGQVLAHAPTGRMHRALVETGRAAGVQSLEFPMDQPGLMIFLAAAVDGVEPEALQADMLALIEQREGGPFTEEGVAESRQWVLSGIEVAMRDPSAIGVARSEAIAQGVWRLLPRSRDRIEQVTADYVNRVAQACLQRNNRTA